MPSGFDPGADARADVLAHAAECLEPLVLSSGDRGGIGEAPIQSRGGAGKERTTLVRVVAYGDHVDPLLAEERIKRFGRRASDRRCPRFPAD